MSQNINMGWGLIEADQVWRKGPWTAEEDKLLVEYVKLHGEGRWNNVARLAGLKRNGKSCRLRWVNYLRPDLKRGQITPHEESLIIELHARWGNRWSTIARSLPGRTDNEIKNYWRTHFKKKGTKPSSTQNPEKSRARLLRRQQFQQLQKQINHHHQHHQQDQIDMKKIMSPLFKESDDDDKSPTNFTQLRQEIGYCYPNMLDDQAGYFYSTVVNGSCGAAPPEAVSNEDMIIWGDGFMWNMDLTAASCFY